MLPISLVVVFRNEEKRLPRLLKSVEGVVSEVVYGNNASEDGSEDVVLSWCRERGVTAKGFYEERVVGYPEPFFQRAFDMASLRWTLLVGADEEVTLEGREFLKGTETERLEDCCALRWASVILGAYDGSDPQQMMLWCGYQLRLWRTGSVMQPPFIHTPARPLPGKTQGFYGGDRPFIQQKKSGFEQLVRDQARGQHLHIERPALDPYAEKAWGEMFSC
jgi:hypothetical protein